MFFDNRTHCVKLKWNEICNRNFEQVDDLPGVYIISVRFQNSEEYLAMYVGQSEKIKERLQNHFSDNEDNQFLKLHISRVTCVRVFYAYCNEKNLNRLELFLYNKLDKPPCNNRKPPGNQEVECNVPRNLKSYWRTLFEN